MLSAKDYGKQLGISKLNSNCPISQQACQNPEAEIWWQLAVGNPPDAVSKEIELQGFSECDDLKEAATVQPYPIRVEAADFRKKK